MKTTALALAGSLLLCSAAAAQPTPPTGAGAPATPPPAGEAPPPADAPPPPPADPGDDPPDHPPAAPYLTRRAEPPPAPAAPVRHVTARPTGLSLGLGLGYSMPTEILVPNLASLRVRFKSGLTLEPTLSLTRTTTEDDDGFMTIEDLSTLVDVGLGVRGPLYCKGRVDLMLTGRGSIAFLTSDPEGPANAQLTSVMTLDYGLALDYWLNRNWSVSINSSNPLLQRTNTSRQTGTGNPEVSSTATTIGAVFNPRLSVMIHLYL